MYIYIYIYIYISTHRKFTKKYLDKDLAIVIEKS